MTNNPVQKPLPIPPPRARQETVSFEGDPHRVSGAGNPVDRTSHANSDLQRRSEELERRVAELERKNTELEAQNAREILHVKVCRAQIARLEADQKDTPQDLALCQKENRELRRIIIDENARKRAAEARSEKPMTPGEKAQANARTREDVAKAFMNEWEKIQKVADGLLAFVQNVTGLPAAQVEEQLPEFLRLVLDRSTAEQVVKAVSERAPTTERIRDSAEYIPTEARPASRSPYPGEVAPATKPSRAQPVSMPPVAPIASTPPGDDGEVELDIDDPNNPGRRTWDMGELPPVTR